MFAFDPSLLPSLRTRKALLILDLQNDFLSPDGALPVSEPKGYVQRAIDVANAFRQSGSGDVIWVRSEFAGPRAIINNNVLTSDLPIPTTASARSRRVGLGTGRGEADHEAFLSLADDTGSPEPDDDGGEPGPKPECVRPGKTGSALADHVAAAVATGRDSVLTKTEYSAFQSGQLLKLLRTRFATELFICGALTNVSIHATALDGASHGLQMTIVNDCCGYRSAVRHTNAIRNLVQLTGCETTTAQDLISSLTGSPSQAAANSPTPISASMPIREKKEAGRGSSTTGPIRTGGGADARRASSGSRSSPKDKFVRDTSAKKTTNSSSSPAAPKDDLKTLSDASPAAAKSTASQPQASQQQPLQTMVGSGTPDDRRPVQLSTATSGSTSAVPSLDQTSTASDSLQHAGDSPAPKTLDSNGSSRDSENPLKGANDKPPAEIKAAADVSRPNLHVVDDEKLESSEKPTPQSSSLNSTQEHEEGKEEKAPVAQMKEECRRPTPSEPLCEGDTTIFHDVLSEKLESGIFERLRDEVRWLRMSHQGGEVPRLVCVQGEVDAEGNIPVYRHPSDESPPLVPFSPTVLEIKKEIEEVLGHSLNHALIQFYRSGNDYISEHSDKTLDIAPGSFIANVSLGAERTMVLRTKRPDKDPSRKPGSPERPGDQQQQQQQQQEEQQDDPARRRQIVRARLPHNSLCRMGLKTNERWLHAIRQDKRMDRDKTEPELAFSGGRISLTFRKIGTFLDRDFSVIWGQGATSKTREGAKPVVNGQSDEAVRMLRAFGTENHSSAFDWDTFYGQGFDVLHMSSSPRFFSGPDHVVNMRIQLMLAAFGISYAKGSVGGSDGGGGGDATVKFIDNDPGKASIHGDVAVMLYLDAVHRPNKNKGAGADADASARPELARELTRFQQALGLLDKWKAASAKNEAVVDEEAKEQAGADDDTAAAALSKKAAHTLKPLARELAVYDTHVAEVDAAATSGGGDCCFIAGGASASIADYALWPVLHDMASSCGGPEAFVGGLGQLKLGRLAGYYESFAKAECVRRVLDGDVGKPAAQA
ncbi:isochorismatase [Magnaporthiopsis poae ATCC 64411]|uniref:Isochorismatase n=1 Tax=Magnaporthiopsis poae (strain ATCC 64411 / 73-15) TaxID=644358 RepID=A0A0C4DS93_MAGP6|nr:isochorismatase [Magnaporthiopsis poae ATCC 64411]